MSDQFDAWDESKTPKKPARSSRTTGMILIGGVFAAILCLLGLLIAYNFGVARPTQARIAGATATAETKATARVQATADYWTNLATAPPDWSLLLDEKFDSPERWKIGVDEMSYGVSDVTIADGALLWEVSTQTSFYTYRTPNLDAGDSTGLGDFLVTVDTRVVRSNEYAGNWGVMFRQTASSYYAFNVSKSGYYTVMYHDRDGWEQLVPWNELPDAAIRPPYKIMVRGEGDLFYFFVNDTYLTRLKDDRLTRGKVGLGIDLSKEGQRIIIEFDNMTLYAPLEDSSDQ